MPEIPHRNIEAEILDIEERTWDASGAQELQDIKEDIESLFEELEKAIGLYHKKETIQKIVEDEKPLFSAEPFRYSSGFKKNIFYIKKI